MGRDFYVNEINKFQFADAPVSKKTRKIKLVVYLKNYAFGD